LPLAASRSLVADQVLAGSSEREAASGKQLIALAVPS
jgi:hypothetical protein